MTCLLEINFLRLLSRTEVFSNQELVYCHLNSYVSTLELHFKELISSDYRPNAETVRNYELRLNNVKELLSDKLSQKPSDTAVLLRTFESYVPLDDDCTTKELPLSESNDTSIMPTAFDEMTVRNNLSVDAPDLVAMKRQQIYREMREQLLGDPQPTDSKSAVNSASILKEQKLKRDQLTQAMLGLVNDLRDQSHSMGQRLRSDRETVEGSIEQAAKNASQLSNVLNDLSKELGSKCGHLVLFLLIVAIFMFGNMIFIMKMFRKRVATYNTPSVRSNHEEL